ncbi:MAG: PilN domain-containing protein [Pseudomonadota bacterium]
MIKINLLPHREAKRKLKKTAFMALLGVGAFVGVVIVVMVGGYNQTQISTQNERNELLKTANGELDKKIAAIATLKQEIEALKARQQAVEDLQGDRNQPVYLLDELVKQVPQGVFLKSFKQDGQRVAMVGQAQSQERVAELLRNLAGNSPWLDRPDLSEVKAVALGNSKSGKQVVEFTLSVGIKRLRDKEADLAAAKLAESAAAGTPGASPAPPPAAPAAQ